MTKIKSWSSGFQVPFYHDFQFPFLISHIILLTVEIQYNWFKKVAIEIIISLFPTTNSVGQNLYIISAYKAAYEHVLQTYNAC